jgi:hypothetical protein
MSKLQTQALRASLLSASPSGTKVIPPRQDFNEKTRLRLGARWRLAAETELRPPFRPANYDAWETNDFFTSDDRMAVFSLALYKCLSACKSKGRNSATSRTNLSLPLPISVNATVSIFSFFINSYRLTSSVVCPSSIIVFAYVLSPKLMFRWACHFLWVKDLRRCR